MAFLSKHLKMELRKDPSLNHRNRAPALFIRMGMEVSMVEAHFRFNISFEKEMDSILLSRHIILLLGNKVLFLEFFKSNDWGNNDSEKRTNGRGYQFLVE
jgi:hypothetical protein